ncbi:MAG: hypothetical protein A3H70_01525 [Candidatus Komeilibacteria bacterium RIFCSPLOWO2_02_FULL_48_11]|uniref:Plasmid pRiA4b Orf3-like domain-containing protein n=1 Tax=Candidatus Komeilibacteria bacterium RIFCSPLOWO2_02_FULL_48_11 TaxID=1798553 RepID=A0A1G2BW54_9BACT|nr:MAG: hypothetical protein A3H70_01525 [Candidatus Komeilibacteria bacterium RIFCSPLOWO2_02_FULL_48_11]
MPKKIKRHTAKPKAVKSKGDARNTVFRFKITLDDSSPKVWRRILVPANYTFFDFHVAIQNAMGWCDGHLHAFHIAQKGTAKPLEIRFSDPENDDQFGGEFLDERLERIADYFGKLVKQCKYCYDFGDNWDHTILFEREMPAEPGADYPQCTAGANACPPEDCGGVWGYRDLQKILANPRHKEHQEMAEWMCLDDAKDFDPAEFDAEEAEFEDPRHRLKEYEQGFGVKPVREH